MIIRLTVHDNDFSNILSSFMKNLYKRLTAYPINFDEMEMTEKIKIIMQSKDIERILNPNVDENYTNIDYKTLINKIKETFSEFVNMNDKDSFEYLMDNLDVTIINSFDDKWENGEAWYWLQHSGVSVNQ